MIRYVPNSGKSGSLPPLPPDPMGTDTSVKPTSTPPNILTLAKAIHAKGSIEIDGKSVTPPCLPGNDQFIIRIGREWFVIVRLVSSRMIGPKFADIVRLNDDGTIAYNEFSKAERFIVKLGFGKSSHAIIWEGAIDVTFAYRAFEITPSRTPKPLDWSRYARLRITNSAGNTEMHDIPQMQLRQPQAKAEWLDSTNLGLSGRATDCKNYVMCLLTALPENGMVIHGQGPVKLDNDTIIFCAKSVVFDTEGEIRTDVTVNISGLPEMYRYYDITPIKEITEAEIIDGCNELLMAYDESPAYPEIPAAFLGQLFTAVLPRINPSFFSSLIQTGVKGSGKTFYSARYDSIQSRTLRQTLKLVMPVINLGDTTGTAKGPKYRVREFGGFAITTDDVIKSGDAPYRITERSETVSSLIRSFLSGGGPSATVNHAINRVVSAESIMLHSSIKFLSEKRIVGDSTLDRTIILPHLNDAWGENGSFDKPIADRLSMPESRESQHRAWSALEYWLFQRINTTVQECIIQALNITRAWDIESRIADNYAALIAGHFIFAEFCNNYGIDASKQVNTAVEALALCAQRQAELSIPLIDRFRITLRKAITAGKVAIPGLPIADPDGMPTGNYGPPWLAGDEITLSDGTIQYPRSMPPGITNPDSLGLIGGAKIFQPKSSATTYGYVMPPRDKTKGARKGSDLRSKWIVAFPTGDKKWQNLCDMLTEYGRMHGGYSFDQAQLVLDLVNAKLGGKVKIRILKGDSPKITTNAVIEIDCEWLFAESEDF